MQVEPGGAAVFVSAIGLSLVALLVLYLDFSQRVNRAFALLLVLRAVMDMTLVFDPRFDSVPSRLRVYFSMAIPFAAAQFALVYRARHAHGRTKSTGWWTLGITLAALMAELAYLFDHAKVGTPVAPGPMFIFVYLPSPSLALVAAVFAWDLGRARTSSQRMALFFASLGLVLAPLFVATFELLLQAVIVRASLGWSLGTLDAVSYGFTLALSAGVVIRLFTLSEGRQRPLLVACVLAAVASGVVLVLGHLVIDDATITNAAQVLDAFFLMALPIFVTFALVRHRLFDAEVKLRFAIKGTTLATIFVATFFVVAKLTETWAEETFGQNWVVGAVAAGLLLFLISPLQAFAERLAKRAVPGKGMSHRTHDERLHLYREQLEIAWADGRLTPKERLLFARLQERLGIRADEASKLETEVLAALEKPHKVRKGRQRTAA